MVWRKGGVARKLGRDEQHLHDALRWLGLSSRSMTEAEASAWEQAEAIKVDTVLETRPPTAVNGRLKCCQNRGIEPTQGRGVRTTHASTRGHMWMGARTRTHELIGANRS